jgi:hypothetical protein
LGILLVMRVEKIEMSALGNPRRKLAGLVLAGRMRQEWVGKRPGLLSRATAAIVALAQALVGDECCNPR